MPPKDIIPSLEVWMKYLKEGFDEIKQDLKSHIASENLQIDRIEKLIGDWTDKADSKYASKNVELVVYWILWLLLAWMASTLIYFVFEHIWLPK